MSNNNIDATSSMRSWRNPSQEYGPLPWSMSGSSLTVFFKLESPEEARRRVPPMCDMDPDPIVRARFWELDYEPGLIADENQQASERPHFREAVIAFPVSFGDISGDYTAHMYADDPTYIAFGREVMGWPLMTGEIEIHPPEARPPGSTTSLAATLMRGRQQLLRADVTLRHEAAPVTSPLPRWLTWKLIPDVDGRRAAISQLVETGPSFVDWGPSWSGEGRLEFGDDRRNPLGSLSPREFHGARYWPNVKLSLGEGRVLADMREA
jgi:acetoacetate decarboxylase